MREPRSDNPQASELTFSVAEAEVGLRLDRFLSLQVVDISRSGLKKLILEGEVRVNGRSVKPGYEVRFGDAISLKTSPPEPLETLIPRPMPLDILYEDEDILVLNKPAGLVVHPGAGHSDDTLVHGLLAYCGKLASQGGPLRPGIVHRLDQDTSGAMVVARSERAYLNLIVQFQEHRVRKEYLALVYGCPRENAGTIRTMIDRHTVDRKKMAVAENRGREAVSLWKVEKRWEELSLLRVAIETGRTHQIRVHMAHLRHPIVGDETYGGGTKRAKQIRSRPLQELLLKVKRQMLHAKHLAFDHPVAGRAMEYDAELPLDFGGLLDALDRISA